MKVATFAARQAIIHSGQATFGKRNDVINVDLVANIQLLATVPAQPSLTSKKKTTLKLSETTTHFDNGGGPRWELVGESFQSHATKASLGLATHKA